MSKSNLAASPSSNSLQTYHHHVLYNEQNSTLNQRNTSVPAIVPHSINNSSSNLFGDDSLNSTISPPSNIFVIMQESDKERENELREMLDMIVDPEMDNEQQRYSSNESGIKLPQQTHSTNNNNAESNININSELHSSDESLDLPNCPGVTLERLYKQLSKVTVEYKAARKILEQFRKKEEVFNNIINENNSIKERLKKYEEYFAFSKVQEKGLSSLEQYRGELLSKRSTENEHLNNKIFELSSKMGSYETALMQQSEAIKSYKMQMKTLTDQLASSETLSMSRATAIKNLENKLERMNSAYKTNQNIIVETNSSVDGYKQKIASMEREVQKYKEYCEEYKKKAEEAIYEMKVSKKEKSKVDEENVKLRNTVEELNNRASQLEKNEFSQQFYDDYSKNLQERHKAELQKLRKNHSDEIHRLCEDYEGTISTLRNQLQIMSENNKVTFSIGSQTVECKVENSTQTTITSSSLNFEDNERELQKHREEIKRLMKRCTKIESENNELKSFLEKVKREYAQEKEKLIITKQEELENLTKIGGEKESILSSLKQKLEEEERKCSGLQKKLEEKELQFKNEMEVKERDIEEMESEKNKALLQLRKQMTRDKENVLKIETDRIYKEKNKMIDELRERITVLEEKVLREDIDSGKLRQVIETLRNKIKTIKAENLDLIHQNDELSQKLSEFQRTKRIALKYKTKLDQMKSLLTEQISTNQYLRDHLERLNKRKDTNGE
ncbi:hypothetical protein ABK040_010030 [Willaertia magna]